MSGEPQATVVCYLGDCPVAAEQLLTALAGLAAEPSHEVLLAADAAPRLAPLLERVAGDVEVLESDRHVGVAAIFERSVQQARAATLVFVGQPVTFVSGWLDALLAPLADPGVAAVAGTTATGLLAEAPVVAVRRTLVEAAGVPLTADALVLPELLLRCASHGSVVAAPPAGRVLPAARALVRADLGHDPEVTVVIPTLDATGELAQGAVRAVQRTLGCPHEIVIVDNGAPPQGFSAPVNAAIRAARGRYIVVMNDDVEPLPGWWPPLRATLDSGARVVFPDTVDGFRRKDFAAWCFALRRDDVDELSVRPGEFFDPELRVWYQDTDLAVRLLDAGTPPVLVPGSRVVHQLSRTVASDDRQLAAWVDIQRARDRVAFERKHPTVRLRTVEVEGVR
ncbi:glycosyltransferase [Thermoleophilum album]|jgi:hypothetical protein|uniref:glycosyltransferase family 2 protein n=1 Tax=Thermoleophilum album TaxID=29539 RepID=UPI00237CB139|nr:glycosyltransferase [Thermoleophilum album]WDT94586.1 glycosyltransferase [Thermoleophilum album]